MRARPHLSTIISCYIYTHHADLSDTPSPPPRLHRPINHFDPTIMSLLSPRPLHNKENSHHQSSCLSSFISKPTLSGLGRSPRKKASNVHGTKPYSRSTSVHKPASKPVKGGKLKKVPAPLDLAAVRKPVERERMKIGEVNIPLSLPRINVPLVHHLDEFFDPNVVGHPLS